MILEPGKLLVFQPTGSLIAAPTTSLPAEVGGARNWDYRFTWLRDSGLVPDALQQLGYHEEPMQFIDSLEDLCHTGEDELLARCQPRTRREGFGS